MPCKHSREKRLAKIEAFPHPGHRNTRNEVERIPVKVQICVECGDTKIDRDLLEGLDIKAGYYRVYFPV